MRKTVSKGTFCALVCGQHWQVHCFNGISLADCKKTAAVKAGQLHREFCLLLVLCTAEGCGEAWGSDGPALASSRLPGILVASALWTVRSLRGGRGSAGRKRRREGALWDAPAPALRRHARSVGIHPSLCSPLIRFNPTSAGANKHPSEHD